VPRSPGRSGRPWRRIRAQVLDACNVCWWCGHVGADAVDHVIPLARGGPPLDPANLRPIHGVRGCPTCKVKCNSARGDSLRRPAAQGSRVW
jgi:5-methylcytosine-specific restriction endonuclease McrA